MNAIPVTQNTAVNPRTLASTRSLQLMLLIVHFRRSQTRTPVG
jgi:hypothetical protein